MSSLARGQGLGSEACRAGEEQWLSTEQRIGVLGKQEPPVSSIPFLGRNACGFSLQKENNHQACIQD